MITAPSSRYRLISAAASGRSVTSFAPNRYAFGSCRATARTVLAAHWRETLGQEITSIEDVEQPAEGQDAISTAPQRVARVLDSLPDRYRQILEARFRRGNSIKESAAELGISVANAKVLQHRALRLAAQVNDGGQP